MRKWLIFLLALVMLGAQALAEDEVETLTSGDYEYVILEDGTAEIADYNGNAETLEIPEEIDGRTVASIGDWTFSGCTLLTSVTIPESVTSIGSGAFAYCISLTSVTIPKNATSIGDAAFAYCIFLTSVAISEGVTSIGATAFYLCRSLTSVTIPESVTNIGDRAFSYCSPDLILTVSRDSYAMEYAEQNELQYTYPDANDWLNQ